MSDVGLHNTTGLCGSTFWNSTLTWNTDSPKLTPCFEKTVLVWIPCIFLVIFSPFDIFTMFYSKVMNIPWNWRNISKMAVATVAALVEAVDFLNSLKMALSNENIFPVDLYTPILRVLSVLYTMVLMHFHRLKGIRASGVLFIFWFLTSMLGVAQFSSEIKILTTGNSSLTSFFYLPFFICSVLMLLLNFFADLEPLISKYPAVEKPCPESAASFPSKILFAWFGRFASLGYKRPLVNEDLWDLNREDASNELVPEFDKHWQKNARKASHSNRTSFHNSTENIGVTSSKTKPQNISVLPILCIMFGSSFAVGALQKFCHDLLVFVSPQLLNLLIDFVQGKEPMWRGLLYAFVLLLTAALQTLFLAQYFIRMMLIGYRIRTALISAIYRKALRLSNSSRKERTVGEIVNLMAIDAQRFVEFITYINMIWSAPLQIALSIYFLWQLLGWSVFAGLAVMVTLTPLHGFIARRTETLQVKQMKYKDERVKMMNEMLSGIKVLKLYAWEPSFEQMVQKIREKEVRVLKKAAYLHAFMVFTWCCAPFLVSLVTFAVYVLADETHVLDAKTAFVSVSLFNLLRFPLSMLPTMISQTIQVWVSIGRINKFMNSEELDPNATVISNKADVPLVMEEGTFTWDADSAPILKNISLKIEQGSLVAVVGAVGAGKSSLISAFLGEMEKVTGRVYSKGSVAYVPQIAWIQNATLQDNILFGNHLNKKFYHSVVDACAFKPDLDMLPGGDQTEIGEKGINLSGGQKQRVSLARAVYCDSDIYFLDDPLSAVDSHVGKHIFDRVIGSQGILHGKTRILVTHSVAFLPEVDLIVVLKDGSATEIGTYSELLEKKGAFSEFINTYLLDVSKEELDENVRQQLLGGNQELLNLLNKQISVSSDASSEYSVTRRISANGSNKSLHKTASYNKEKDKLIEEERTEIGGVKWEVYSHYLRSVGLLLAAAAIIFNVISESFFVGSNFWLSAWSSDNTSMLVNGTKDLSKRDMYLGVYGAFGFGQSLSTYFMAISFAKAGLKASNHLHRLLLRAIARAPLSFTDITPIGRILSRFSKDVESLDMILPGCFNYLLYCLCEVLGTIFVVSYTTPMFLVVILPIGVVYYFVQCYYVATSRQLKRLESVSRSPIYSHFSETITGAPVLRAYNVQSRFIKESESKVDFNQICIYPGLIADRWLGVRLEMAGNFVIFFSALLVVLGRETLSAGLAGLSISYALQMTESLNWLVRMTAEVETNIVAVERIKGYTETPQEAAWEITPNVARAQWPEEGRVEFKNYSLRYRDGLDLVLKDLTIVVNGGEKIGIVGRTGAGKSSLTLGLFRIVEPAGGQILIDDIDISNLGLHVLRSKLTIIPQDPVLFSGSLRVNLDPFERYSDDEIWRALELAHLKSFVSSLPTLLQHQVSESGENLSVGQRQLICLARALLRKTKVLVLDEATAAVDLETDDLIQKTIRTEFASCTVLTIAHRINTIMDSDRVLVLDKGTLKEFDAPDVLLKRRDSTFFAMAKDAGIVT